MFKSVTYSKSVLYMYILLSNTNVMYEAPVYSFINISNDFYTLSTGLILNLMIMDLDQFSDSQMFELIMMKMNDQHICNTIFVQWNHDWYKFRPLFNGYNYIKI